jgi:hypothetical protein
MEPLGMLIRFLLCRREIRFHVPFFLHDQACIFSLPYICFITIQGMQLERLLQE